jgi:hypothetical protein
MNRLGVVDCDVICPDYYHIMGCPEWEDADFTTPVDHFYPQWTKVDLGTFERPRWFAQGPLDLCVTYLCARREGRAGAAERLWRRLRRHNPTRGRSWQRIKILLGAWNISEFVSRKLINAPHTEPTLLDKLKCGIVLFVIWGLRGALFPLSAYFLWESLPTLRSRKEFLQRASTIVQDFDRSFPHRIDRLREGELATFKRAFPLWAKLFKHYDIVQAYATLPILPYLDGSKPFIGFEHGTLRTFTLNDDAVSRMTAISYRMADHVFVTNGDCREYAERIGVSRYSPMLHPIDDVSVREITGDYESLHRSLGVRHVFLCPLRHDWEIKGTDKYLRVLPDLVDALNGDLRLILTTWGAQVDDSRRLVRELCVEDYVVWREPLPRIPLVRLMKSVDVVFDQIALPCFGATAPLAIAAEVPVIMSYEPKSTEWIVDEPAPILTAWTSEEIVECVQRAIDPQWRADYVRRARAWFDRCHSSSKVVDWHLAAYGELLAEKGLIGA